MSKILVIGIDGMDWNVLEPLLPELPNLSRIADSGYAGKLVSIFPPDSIPSWISIFTGLDPSEHGILESIDYFKKDIKQFSIDTSAFRGKTFWDRASEIGKRVLIVNPLLAYPPWPVNGIMASGPVFVSGETATTPSDVISKYRVPPLGGIVDFPEKRELRAFKEKTAEDTLRIAEFASALMANEEWDLAFVTFLTLDRMQHFFWRYQDPEDPTYPGRNRHETAIKDFHLLLDRCVGMLLENCSRDCIVMILSDHGHGRRPAMHFNLNELLRSRGYLESRIGGPKFLSARYHIDRAKNAALEILHRLDLEDLSYRLARVFPWTRKLKKGDFLTDPRGNLATASEFGGNNPFGGIEISRIRCREEEIDYEKLRDEIIALLLGVRDIRGRELFLWVKRREELYSGPYLEKLPDILFEMIPEYGTAWSLYRPLFTLNPRHRKISGGHRSSGVLLIGPLQGWHLVEERISPLRVADSIVSIVCDSDEIAEISNRRSFLEKR